jgi:PST family polysaccharide transporter
LIGQIGEKLPEAIIGGIAGLEALAFYRVGARGLDSVSQLVVQPAAGVALSALARVDPSEREQQFSRLVRILALVAVPTYLGAGGVAPEFVELLFGAQWSSSAIVMTLLAFTAPSCLLLPLISQQLLAVGMSRQLMLASVINTGLVCAPVLGASFVTLTTSVSAQAFGANVALIAVLSLFCKSMSFSFGGIIKCLAPALSAGALMMLAILVLRPLIEHFPLLERLAMLLCVGACAYVLSLLVLFREYSRLAWTELAPVLPWHIARMKPGSLM